MLFFTENDVRRLLPMPQAIECMRSAFRAYAEGHALNQPRRRLFLPSGTVLHSMAGAYGGYLGTKIYTTNPRHGAHFTVLLYNAETGTPLARLEANYLGQIRTGAVSGLAADLLAPDEAITLGVIGSGFQAETQVEAVATVRRIRSVNVWSRREAHRESFAERMSERIGAPVRAVSTAEAAAAGSEVLITATNSKDPVLRNGPLAEVKLLIAVGSNHPGRRELPSEAVLSRIVVVDDVEQCRMEAGDLLLAFSEQDWTRVVPLASLAAGKTELPEKERPAIFKSVGLGFEDVAAAAYLLAAATPEQQSADPHLARR
jgi:ornithine cyclodeaminase/alanine dehydrogenase-like protein (mu-crystallin family)